MIYIIYIIYNLYNIYIYIYLHICVYIVECKLLTSLFSAALLLKTFHNAPRTGTSIRHPSPGRTSVPRADISCVVFCLFFFSFYIGLAVAADPYIEEVCFCRRPPVPPGAPSSSTWALGRRPSVPPGCRPPVSASFLYYIRPLDTT